MSCQEPTLAFLNNFKFTRVKEQRVGKENTKNNKTRWEKQAVGVTDGHPQECKLNLQCCRLLVLLTLDREDFLGLGVEKGQLGNFGGYYQSW